MISRPWYFLNKKFVQLENQKEHQQRKSLTSNVNLVAAEMTKWGRNILLSNVNNNKNITTRRSEKYKTRLNKTQQQQSQTITSRSTAKRFFSANEQSCGLSLSHVVVATIFLVLVSITTNNLSTVNCKLTRKTYTVWDLSPKEFESLLEQEKSLQKRKKSLDYFLRRRSKKTKEDLPSLLEEAPSNGNFLFEDGVSNNLGINIF